MDRYARRGANFVLVVSDRMAVLAARSAARKTGSSGSSGGGAPWLVPRNVPLLAVSLVACGMLAAPPTVSAQSSRRASVVVECGPGQRAVTGQRRVNGRTHAITQCEDGRRQLRSNAARRVSQRSGVEYVEYERERSKTKTALMIAGSAATGAGVGGALGGTKGALIGAAVGGGAASIYEATKRR